MQTKTIFIAGIALVIGLGGGYAFASKNNTHESMSTHTIPTSSMSSTSNSMNDQMHEMTATLSGKEGDDFDKAFLIEMTTHHKGAVEMSLLAQKNAKHVEIKQLSQKILTSQLPEIQQMQQWLKVWYGIEQ